ncbi:STAS domain-containing protein [Streptomyces tropicalis]|uniref:STAS domain-containing protein n=1 Tax=Streptomyces tropicalis TaxID=3034234 RepID=A0ABT6A2J0_9ACTN|nr:STAS domain-containing protein [Streptomyces tropicalis]MDF3298855.1 STAS domain-containing protein [Streptomyces tropicalis]
MAPASHPAPGLLPTVAVTAGGRRAELTLTGDLDAATLRELEERLVRPPLDRAGEWVLDMSGVSHLDLACAYALLRAATQRPEIAALTIRGARRPVQRTLRHAGIDTIAEITD